MPGINYSTVNELLTNEETVFTEAVDVLLRIIRNVTREPQNAKFRSISIGSSVVQNKLLPANGAFSCLFEMGFVEKGSTQLELPTSASLETLRELEVYLNKLKTNFPKSNNSPSKDLPKTNLDRQQPTPRFDSATIQFSTKYSNPFLQRILKLADDVMKYENVELLAKALQHIPLVTLNLNVEKSMRRLQEKVKKGKFNETDIDYQELLLYELMVWFKNDFFKWVNYPDCNQCGKLTDKLIATRMEERHNNERIRVEVYRCEKCQKDVLFPRHNDPEVLLDLRRGRCGEWSNCFALLCRALGWDVRWVMDETDHVWTEVYLQLPKKWVHCDPCETILDAPLMYEAGWKKQITYVMAYSCDEVQDVTWRYTSNHKDVCLRRTLCSETELSTLLAELREFRCQRLTKIKKDYIFKRSLFELCSLMIERKPTENELKGRMSGSLSWRLARGEVECDVKPHIWQIDESFLDDNKKTAIIRYNTSKDQYYVGKDDQNGYLSGWQAGLHQVEGIHRKTEHDWKMVYLARSEGTTRGKLVWKFQINKSLGTISKIEILLRTTLFKTGRVNALLCTDDICVKIPESEEFFISDAVSGCESFTISAVLTGGEGDLAWQHSQLFRQSLHSQEYTFFVKIHLS